jgi:hypothetical protein
MDDKAFTCNEYVIGKMGVHFAEPRSTAVRYSNAIDYDKASLLSIAQIHAQTSLDDRHAPSSQRGGQRFASPQFRGRSTFVTMPVVGFRRFVRWARPSSLCRPICVVQAQQDGINRHGFLGRPED